MNNNNSKIRFIVDNKSLKKYKIKYEYMSQKIM